MDLMTSEFWIALLEVIWVNILLSGDNAVVIAVAAAANSAPTSMHTPLLIIGLGLSIPLIIFGSALLLKLMQRFPAIITLGAALLGFVSGEMAFTDAAVHEWFETHMHGLNTAISLTCAAFVVMLGMYLAKRQTRFAQAQG